MLPLVLLMLPLALGIAGCSCDSDGDPNRDLGMPMSDMDTATPDNGGGVDAGDPCEGVTCMTGQVCVPQGSLGRCVADCSAITCDPGYSCSGASGTAECIVDCSNFPCPSGQTCSAAGDMPLCVNGCDPTCGSGQRCETQMGVFVCVDNTCGDLMCGATEVCEAAPGGGFICADNSCMNDLMCDAGQNCTGGICVDDVCTPGERSCDSGNVIECLGNGSGTFTRFSCPNGCDDSSGEPVCPCAADWECPAFTECVVDTCVGTGVAPTCFLQPQPFTNVLPTPEITWGGQQGMTAARDGRGNQSPFDNYNQAIVSPVVINLTDDNGDGLINELDDPEILFLTLRNSVFRDEGVLRAIHGGGPDKGADYFATCGTNTWHEGDAVPANCPNGTADLNATSAIAAGDLDGDGVPEIVVLQDTNDLRFTIFDNRGDIISTYNAAGGSGEEQNPAVSLANVDGAGFAEIIVGKRIFTLYDNMGTLEVQDEFRGGGVSGFNGQGAISCVADMDGDGRMEVIAGSTVYRFPRPPAGVTSRADCAGPYTDPDEVAYCSGNPGTPGNPGQLLVLWNGASLNAGAEADGFCAIADVIVSGDRAGMVAPTVAGPGNPLDGLPDLVLVGDGRVQVFDHEGTMLINEMFTSERGGAPNVDDFDGDGFPEVGTAGATAYRVFDFQPPTANCPDWPDPWVDDAAPPAGNPARTPNAVSCSTDADCGFPGEAVCNTRAGQCTCLHNGWSRRTEDGSSKVTGSTLFDFNGDGAVEVVYNDECYFRVYDGRDGTVYFKEPSESRTRIEYPIVADVDNDGNAEIVFAASNESGFCEEGEMDAMLLAQYNNGLEVWGDAGDFWVSARRIWNQHSYHVTNVYEGGQIPVSEPPSWVSLNGRLYNSYRANPQSPFGIAPDLQVQGIQVTSPDAACGTFSSVIDITARVVNAGDLRVGAGIPVAFFGTWAGMEQQLVEADGTTPLVSALPTALEAGGEVFITVTYDSAGMTPAGLPDSVRVEVDNTDVERECFDNNNDDTQVLTTGAAQADLRVTIDTVSDTCPNNTVAFTIHNDGNAAVMNPVVRFFAGDPNAGGQTLHTATVTGTVPAGGTLGGSMMFTFPRRIIELNAVVDPNDEVAECNDGNNDDAFSTPVDCTGGFG